LNETAEIPEPIVQHSIDSITAQDGSADTSMVVAVPAAYRAVMMSPPKKTPAIAVNGSSGTGVRASSPPTCWDAFAPPYPNGIEMYQYYRNCNGYELWVYPGYHDTSGNHALGGCVSMPDGYYIFWHYGSTIRGVNYGTFVC